MEASKDLLRAFMLSQGFAPGAPNSQTAVFDRTELSLTDCRNCGETGLVYRPFTRYDEETPRYRFYGVCPKCRHEEEF